MGALTSLHVPIKSSFGTYQDNGDAQKSVFLVPARRKGQRPILFGRISSEPTPYEESEGEEEPPQFNHYEPKTLKMMKRMGYDLINRPGLNFGKGRRSLLRSFVPKGKAPDYYHQTRRGLGYVSTPVPSASDSEEPSGHDHSSGTSSWESDVSVGNIFKALSVNMASTSHLEDEDKEMIQSDTDPWIKHRSKGLYPTGSFLRLRLPDGLLKPCLLKAL